MMRKKILLGCMLTALLCLVIAGCAKGPNSGSGTSDDNSSEECPGTNLEWVIQEEATCTVKGIEALKCVDCGKVYDIRELPLKDHEYADDFLCHDRKCKNCDFVMAAQEPHSKLTDVRYIAPTCIENGSKVYTCGVCGETYNETIQAYNLYSYDLYSSETHHGWLTVSATLDIDSNLDATITVESTGSDWGTTSLCVSIKTTDTLRVRITKGRCDIKLKGANIDEQVLAMGLVAGEYDINMSEYIAKDGEYDLFVYPRGSYGSECVIDELSLLPKGTSEWHKFENGVCNICGETQQVPQISDNYGDLYSEEFADRWIGAQHYTLDGTSATYRLERGTTYLDSWLSVKLARTDYINFEVVAGRFQVVVKDKFGKHEIKKDFDSVGKYSLSVEEYFGETVDKQDTYQFWIVPLSDGGEASVCTIKDLRISQEEFSYYGNLYDDIMKEYWSAGYNCDGNKNYFSIKDGTATYVMDGSVTWFDTKMAQITLKQSDKFVVTVVSGKIQVVVKTIDGSKEAKTGDIGVGEHTLNIIDLFGSVVNAEGDYQLWIVPLTDQGVPSTIVVKNFTLTAAETENYGSLYGNEYIDQWSGKNYFTVQDGAAVYSMDGSVTWVDSYIVVRLKPTDIISFTIETNNCTGISFMLKKSDGTGEFYKETYGPGTYTLTASELGVAKDGIYRLQISPITDMGVAGTVTVKNLCISKS